MRENCKLPSSNLHWHGGSTCHGYKTAQACAENAIAKGWTGRVLEREDVYANGDAVKCYSLIASDFEHYAKQGKYVAEVRLVVVAL